MRLGLKGTHQPVEGLPADTCTCIQRIALVGLVVRECAAPLVVRMHEEQVVQ